MSGWPSACFLLLLFLASDRFFHRQSRAFSLDKILSTYPYSEEWEIPSPSDVEKNELKQILSQTFTYYSKGTQSYVFISEDKKYILKFFKQIKFRPSSWLSAVKVPFNPYYQEGLFKQQKRAATFSACKTAFLELRELTGVIYVHLNNTH